MNPTKGAFEYAEVDGIDKLKERLANAETTKDLSFILSDYLSFGNTKIADSVAIFNINAAVDCPNAGTEACQVAFEDCYAHKAENIYPNTLDYRRRQQYLWDHLSADEWAEAFKELVSRKRKTVETIRFSEAGDFRSNGDIRKVDKIAETLSEFEVYTYSASHYLDWSLAEHFTINASNELSDFGDRLYSAVDKRDDIPEDGVQCAYEASDGDIQCGDCKMCIDSDFDKDVYITLH